MKRTPRTTTRATVRFLFLHPAFCLSVLLVAILLLFWSPEPPRQVEHSSSPVQVTGLVSRRPELTDGELSIEIKPERIERQGRRFPLDSRIRLYVSSPISSPDSSLTPPLRWGDRVGFRAALNPPAYYAVPGVPDARLRRWLRGAYYSARLKSPLLLERLEPDYSAKTILVRILVRYVDSFRKVTAETLNYDSRMLVDSAVLGIRQTPTVETWDLFRRNGLVHLLVVSGFHVALVMGTTHLLLRRFGRFRIVATLATVWIYVTIVGYTEPATRAGIMASVAFLACHLGVRSSILNSLGAAACFLLIWSPGSLYLPSFQFTFTSMLMLVACIPFVQRIQAAGTACRDFRSETVLTHKTIRARIRRRARFILEGWLQFVPGRSLGLILRLISFPVIHAVSLALMTLCIQVGLLPLLLYHSNQLSLSAFAANTLVMPLFSLFVPVGLLFLATFKSPLVWMLAPLLNTLGILLMGVIQWIDRFSISLNSAHPSVFEAVFYCITVLVCTLSLTGWKKVLSIPLSASLLLVMANQSLHGDDRLTVTLLDVGQGDSIHVRYPDGSNGLIDTGGSPFPEANRYLGRRVLARYFWHERISQLDYILLTHPEGDHEGAYEVLTEVIPVNWSLFHAFRRPYRNPAARLESGLVFNLGGVIHRVVHPSSHEETGSPNDASIVLELRYGLFSMLFTGDITAGIESDPEHKWPQVFVLKVAHHGSKTSTTDRFLASVQPSLALISAGRRNPFGHPDPVVVQRLQDFGVRAYSTAERGSIRLVTDGTRWELFAYPEPESRFVSLQSGLLQDSSARSTCANGPQDAAVSRAVVD